jgi:hypothetical protein
VSGACGLQTVVALAHFRNNICISSSLNRKSIVSICGQGSGGGENKYNHQKYRKKLTSHAGAAKMRTYRRQLKWRL